MSHTDKKKENLLFLAWGFSVIAMFGSLYFSEIKGYEPCELCWYQRILMYPMALILGIAVVKKDFKISFYTMILSCIGGLISIYHVLIQKVTFFTDSAPACGRVPCTSDYINWLGFITIPLLALTAFILIFITSLLVWKNTKED
ncbi:disulfide bond formation protein DsbB [Peribacillus deserti]|uniref:Probable disulfide formation protein n=1 Tax=Peribacillus deserti TaxID=673318 RepID=A0ABS2QM58_9BACI|nr:disulfide oxidoreductase [Peribacillus deserti]MBM7694262.1 disulfide bond formation protein DsbB [Peribacillus deserti]